MSFVVISDIISMCELKCWSLSQL